MKDINENISEAYGTYWRKIKISEWDTLSLIISDYSLTVEAEVLGLDSFQC